MVGGGSEGSAFRQNGVFSPAAPPPITYSSLIRLHFQYPLAKRNAPPHWDDNPRERSACRAYSSWRTAVAYQPNRGVNSIFAPWLLEHVFGMVEVAPNRPLENHAVQATGHVSEPKPLFSAVVLCFNAENHIGQCLERLIATFASFDESSEAIVVENGSADGSRARVENLAGRYPDMVKPLYCHTNLGTTVSRNHALEIARGRYVLVIDADAWIDADALRTLRDTLDQDPKIGLVAPQLRYPDGRYQLSADTFPTIGRKIRRWFRLRSLESQAAPPEKPADVDYAISACWLMRREVQCQIGPFDERIFYSPEDVDYCVRIWLGGYRVVYQPAAVAIHHAQESSRFPKLGYFTLRHVTGLAYYFWKHRYCLNRKRLVDRFPR